MRAVQVAGDRAGPGPRGSGWTCMQVLIAAHTASLVVTKGSAYPPKVASVTNTSPGGSPPARLVMPRGSTVPPMSINAKWTSELLRADGGAPIRVGMLGETAWMALGDTESRVSWCSKKATVQSMHAAKHSGHHPWALATVFTAKATGVGYW